MVVYYQIAGRKIGSHVLAMGVLGVFFGGIAMSVGGKKQVVGQQGPPINAKSPDEEKFVQDFLKKAEAGSNNTANAAKH